MNRCATELKELFDKRARLGEIPSHAHISTCAACLRLILCEHTKVVQHSKMRLELSDEVLLILKTRTKVCAKQQHVLYNRSKRMGTSFATRVGCLHVLYNPYERMGTSFVGRSELLCPVYLSVNLVSLKETTLHVSISCIVSSIFVSMTQPRVKYRIHLIVCVRRAGVPRIRGGRSKSYF